MHDHRDRSVLNPALRRARLRAPLLVGLIGLSGLGASNPGQAQTIYRHVDENGVVSFSDVQTEGSQSMTLEVREPRENAFDEQQALIEQQLTVAKALEESRLAREDARTRRIEAQAKSAPQTVYYREDDRRRYVGGRWGWGPGYPGLPGFPGHPGKPVHPIEPPPEVPPTRPVPLPPLNGGG
jgi:hypothetical protein